ncbi:MAG: hypothetical protein ACKVVP_03210 [Chloroflexota bacterium]
MTRGTARTHVVFPRDLMDAIDAVVGRGERSKFLASAAEEKLRRMQLVSVAHRVAGSLKSVDTPDWETSESGAAWVHDARQEDQARLDKMSQP